ncbi:hypothetical protein EOM57_05640 [Candidatus Saccharibacteria bacterium]|nr:hypothetical protein [Candidatus Saccharibacteria bacterium]
MSDDTSNIINSRPSKKQKELLSFIDTFIAGHGYGPSYREIMRGMGYKSVSTVAIHVDGLIARGCLRKRTRSARSLEVIEPSTISTKNTHVVKSEEKWLVDRVKQSFDEYDESPDPKKLDNLYVLVGALHILGLQEAATAYKSRLTDIAPK